MGTFTNTTSTQRSFHNVEKMRPTHSLVIRSPSSRKILASYQPALSSFLAFERIARMSKRATSFN